MGCGEPSDANEALQRQYFNSLKRAVSVMEQGLHETLQDIRDQLDNVSIEDDPGGGRLIYLDHQAAYLAFRVGTTLRGALLVGLYAEVEHALVRLVETFLATRSNLEEPEQGLNRLDIKDAKDFLKREAGVPFPDQSPEWAEMCDIQRLRDAFAHRRGRLTAEEAEGRLGEYVASHPNLFLGGYRQVRVDEGYLEHAMENAARLLERIYANLPHANND